MTNSEIYLLKTNNSHKNQKIVSYTYHEKIKIARNRYFARFLANMKLFKLLGGEIYWAVSRYTFMYFILRIHHILHFCVPRPKFLEPKWSQLFNLLSFIKNVLYNYFPFLPIFIDITICFVRFI